MPAVRSAAFIGSMNAMPMTYALQLREQGWRVRYFVDTPRHDSLSRPECKFPSISYPYPDWIVERPVRSHLQGALLPRLFLRDIIETLRQSEVVFLSGLFLPLAQFLRPEQKALFLSHGSDLDSWCNVESSDRLAAHFSRRIGRTLARLLVHRATRSMVEGLKSVSAVVTFPAGLSEQGDQVLARELNGSGVARIPRYDISFDDLPRPGEIDRPPPSDSLRIICGTRHTFRDHPALTEKENKGTDIIIRALGRYRREGGRRLEVHFFDKGLDLAEAKALCQTEGIADSVTWHRQLPFQDFLRLHRECDIAFDQVGTHWVGTGMYAMYMGMPVIANSRRDALEPFWGERSPICDARNEADIVTWLVRLEDAGLRNRIGQESQHFARRHFDGALTMKRILHFIDGAGDIP